MTQPYSDDNLLRFTVDDPDLEKHRDYLRNARAQARNDFIGAHVTMLEWQTEPLTEDTAALNQEAKASGAAAAQRKENCRTRYAELDRLVKALPAQPKARSAAAAIAKEASRP